MALTSIRALTKLTRQPYAKYFVSAYFLPEQPHIHEREGEIFGYITILGAFNNEREAIEYCQFVIETTGHKSVMVTDAMEWASLCTRHHPIRLRREPETLQDDVRRQQKKLKEQEEIRKKLVQEAEAQLAKEADTSTLAYYARTAYNHLKVTERLAHLKKEVQELEELEREQRASLKKHEEHKEAVGPYFEEYFGEGYSENIKIHLNSI